MSVSVFLEMEIHERQSLKTFDIVHTISETVEIVDTRDG